MRLGDSEGVSEDLRTCQRRCARWGCPVNRTFPRPTRDNTAAEENRVQSRHLVVWLRLVFIYQEKPEWLDNPKIALQDIT
jgi:hypothetical protein